MVEDIPIITGDPLKTKGGASFTCFVLPFRFKPVLRSPFDAKDVYYAPVEMRSSEWVRRMRYFTSETATVLYEQARWFEVSEEHWRSFNWCNNGHSKLFYFNNARKQHIAVRVHPPRLILFESQVSKAKQDDNAETINMFDIGFLIVEASFETDANAPAPDYRDLLLFNELFRYWRIPFEKHPERMRLLLNDCFGDSAEAIYFQRWLDLLLIPVELESGGALYKLFPSDWIDYAQAWWQSEAFNLEQAQPPSRHYTAQMHDSGWITYADNRTFVWSCAVIKEGAKSLVKMGNSSSNNTVKLGSWIKFLNVDSPGDLEWINKATDFEKEWVNERFYDRWLHFGTLYGFNYHAGVMLTAPLEDPPIVHHFHNEYMDMTLLLFYLRLMLFRFSRVLTRLSADMRGTPVFKKRHRDEFKVLRREFAIFTNLYQFPLISNQQQAIEMYELIRKRMDVQDLFKEVEEEIKSSHEYFQFEEESKLNKNIQHLTWIGIVIALIGAIATIVSIPDAVEFLKEFLVGKEQVIWPAIPYPPSPKTP